MVPNDCRILPNWIWLGLHGYSMASCNSKWETKRPVMDPPKAHSMLPNSTQSVDWAWTNPDGVNSLLAWQYIIHKVWFGNILHTLFKMICVKNNAFVKWLEQWLLLGKSCIQVLTMVAFWMHISLAKRHGFNNNHIHWPYLPLEYASLERMCMCLDGWQPNK